MSNIEYYDFTPLLEKNGTYNFVVGGRGIGKTYGAKKLCIEDFIHNGRKFIYLRRYKNELRTIQNMFVDVGKEFPDYAFRVVADLEVMPTHPESVIRKLLPDIDEHVLNCS